MKGLTDPRNLKINTPLVRTGDLIKGIAIVVGILILGSICFLPLPMVLAFMVIHHKFASEYMAWTVIALAISYVLFVAGLLAVHWATKHCR